MSERDDQIAEILEAFGTAIRGDWGGIDGRSIRIGMDGLAASIRSGELLDMALEMRRLDVCPMCKSWTEHCYPDDHDESSE